jgi:hypothetical protein
MHDALSSLAHTHFVLADLHYRIDWKKEVPLPDSDKTARANFQHPDATFVLIDKEAGYVTDVRAMPIDYLAAANVLARIRKGEACVAQSVERGIVRMLLLLHRTHLPMKVLPCRHAIHGRFALRKKVLGDLGLRQTIQGAFHVFHDTPTRRAALQ